MVIRTFQCLNKRCVRQFDAWESNPACPACGCVRVQWVPGGGHIAGVAKAADAELRALADIFKLPDINSAERGRGAKRIVTQNPVDPKSAPPMQFGPGFAAVVDPNRARTSENPSGAQCVPSAAHVDFRAKVPMGTALSHSRSVPGVHTATVIDASHRPRGGA